MNWQNIPGWFDFQSFYSTVADRARDGDTLVEVGVWLGRSLAFLAQQVKDSGKSVQIWAVDNWAGCPCDGMDQMARDHAATGRTVYETFKDNMRACGVDHLIKTAVGQSDVMASSFKDKSLFMVFVDADHSRDAVTRDIEAWFPKVRPGGVFAGHDYNRGEVSGPVNRKFGKDNIRQESDGMTWVYEVPE